MSEKILFANSNVRHVDQNWVSYDDEGKETVAYRVHFVISGTRLPRLARTAVARSASGRG